MLCSRLFQWCGFLYPTTSFDDFVVDQSWPKIGIQGQAGGTKEVRDDSATRCCVQRDMEVSYQFPIMYFGVSFATPSSGVDTNMSGFDLDAQVDEQ